MKILEICAQLNIGGAQAVAANVAKYADKSFEFIYIVFGDDVGEYEADIISRGDRVIHIPFPEKSRLRYFNYLVRLMKEEKIDVVHCHTMYSSGIAMLAAKVAGVKGRVSHSHTAQDNSANGKVRRLYNSVMRWLIKKCSTDFCACGLEAGNRLYGEKFFSENGVIIRNGIDISAYGYSPENNSAIREKYSVADKFIIGHVGHYENVKNQQFLIKLMPELLKQKPNVILMMFGEGSSRERLEKLIRDNNLQDCAMLMGNVSNINEVLSSFDVFAFPSLFEGTPLSLIEAQANGVPCIISDKIPDDACLTGLVKKLPLDHSEQWVESLLQAKRNNPKAGAQDVSNVYETVQVSMNRLYSIFLKYGER